MFDTVSREMLKNDFKYESKKKRNFNNIKAYFNLWERDEYTLDDQSFEDFNMDEVFSKLDSSYSSLGESALYSMLRNPLMDKGELENRSKIIKYLKENEEVRSKFQLIFYKLGYDRKGRFLDMLMGSLEVNKTKYYMYTFLGKVLPILLILLTIIKFSPIYMLALFILVWVNMGVNNHEQKYVTTHGIIYMRKMFDAAKKASSVDATELSSHTTKIKELMKTLKVLDRNTQYIKLMSGMAGFFEVLSIPFLIEETCYYKISSELKPNEDNLLDLYYTLGEIEAFISIAGFQSRNEGKYTTPKFVDEVSLNVIEGIHPLLEKPVSNTVRIKDKGIILTGTNMSGKSTFLRMLGINVILAQSFNFAMAKEYKASFLNVVSSIAPSDDVTAGKSYYMAEAESILRIIKALDKDVPVFCPIDEIFRGTNPIERISSSAEILKYISSKKAISFVATHDKELADILKDSYDFYYFSESVDKKKGLSFDYKLKPGVTKTRNAIKLLEYIGYPKDIIKKSYDRAKTLEGFI